MWNYPTYFDVIVVGAGHAGCEAAHASARLGAKTLLITMNLDTIAKMSCNPSIGGTAKGHIVREIDALGGIMGKIADKTSIHFRILNSSKGPAVRSPRAQVDKAAYQLEMKHLLESTQNLHLMQGHIISLIINKGKVVGITTREGVAFRGRSIILTCGTFLEGQLFIGDTTFSGGRYEEKASTSLAQSLKSKINLGRLKTGTPPRIHRKSIDFSKLEMQPGEDEGQFSFDTIKNTLTKVPCFITYTTEKTKEIILKNLKKSALFSGKITGIGPRYCPSIEDKIVRFSHRERHQIFLEPEGINTEEFYINGISSSMPIEVQMQIISSIIGLEKGEVTRFAYAIEYSYVTSGQIHPTLEAKEVKNLFFAGQINGTTGYEEAAGQGLVAGINGASKALGKDQFILPRSSSYIGVMIDDLITKKLDEPYRMFTSRAEHRLLLRQDNADYRLRELGYHLGLISNQQYQQLLSKKKNIEQGKQQLLQTFKRYKKKNLSLFQLLKRPDISYTDLLEKYPEDITNFGKDINTQIEFDLKYAGYIEKQQKEIEKLKYLENIIIPEDFSYENVIGLKNEAKEKLALFTPRNLSTASRISGISFADISILMIALKKLEITL